MAISIAASTFGKRVDQAHSIHRITLGRPEVTHEYIIVGHSDPVASAVAWELYYEKRTGDGLWNWKPLEGDEKRDVARKILTMKADRKVLGDVHVWTFQEPGEGQSEDVDVVAEDDGIDFELQNHASLVILFALTESAREWVASHLPDDRMTWKGGAVIEVRYATDIIEGITSSGLTLQEF